MIVLIDDRPGFIKCVVSHICHLSLRILGNDNGQRPGIIAGGDGSCHTAIGEVDGIVIQIGLLDLYLIHRFVGVVAEEPVQLSVIPVADKTGGTGRIGTRTGGTFRSRTGFFTGSKQL